jgi:hypothetical protein
VSYKHNVGYKHLEFDRDSIFLVTGGAGFIGSNLCEALLDMGYQVRCMDNFSTGKRENIEGFLHNKNFTLIEDDIRNLEACLVACEGVDYVLHQAAWGSVPRSIEMPLLYESNSSSPPISYPWVLLLSDFCPFGQETFKSVIKPPDGKKENPQTGI